MQKYFLLLKRIRFSLYALIALAYLSALTANICAQNTNPGLRVKGEFVTQDQKEFDKIKKLKVKTRTKIVSTYVMDGKKRLEGRIDTKEYFNKKGLLTKIDEYNVYNKVETSTLFYYDAKGNPTKAIMTQDDGTTRLQLSKYDSRGNEIERSAVQKGRHPYDVKTVLKYDKNNNLIEINNYSDDKLTDKKFNTYNNGKRISSVVKDENENTIVTMTPEYNSSGKIIKETNSNTKGSFDFLYSYDETGNLIGVVSNETKGEYSYDNKSNVVEQKVFLLDGRRQLRLTFVYDSNGLQTEVVRYDNLERPTVHTKFEYEYYK